MGEVEEEMGVEKRGGSWEGRFWEGWRNERCPVLLIRHGCFCVGFDTEGRKQSLPFPMA